MSAKTKLRLQHIEDASKSKGEERMSPEAAALVAAPQDADFRTPNSNPTEPLLNVEAASSSAVGSLLRNSRMERELSLRDIAQQLRIQRSYLEALEEGDFDSLPGLTYAIGYVRSYAKLMDLDPDTLIADFKAEAKKLQEPTQLSFPSPAPEGKVPGGALVFAGVVLAAFSYGAWYYFSTSETAVSELTPSIPDRLAFLLEEPAINTPAAAESANNPPQPAATVTATTARETRKEPSAQVQASADTERSNTASESVSEATPAIEATIEATPAPEVASVTEEPAQRIETPAAPVANTETLPAVPETAALPELASTTRNNPAESPITPAGDATNSAAEATTEATAPADADIPENTAAAVQVASVPEPAPAPVSETIEIPAIPDVPVQAETTTSRSVAEAEAAGIDSKPKPVSAASEPLIVISATDDSWVQVRGTDSSPLLTRILRKGEQYRVPARTGLKLFTGNAGALKISVNGEEAPSLGPFGKIARNIPLDETLLTYTVAD